MASYAEILRFNYPKASYTVSETYESLQWSERNENPKPTKEELDALSEKTDVMVAWQRIRDMRNRLLRQSDWTQLPDVPKETREKWKVYRQHLRDITEFFDDPDFVIFPEAPE